MTQGATISERLTAALRLPNGARFYRCALQVNPFAYLSRHGKRTSYSDEAAYNKAIVETCFELGIEVIGVTDHYRVQESVGLVQAARAAGLFAFSGFEAVSKDGGHFLKMSRVAVEGLRQAFLDPKSRVRLHSDPGPEPHAEFLAMSWEGGFLRDTSIHCNPNLNVRSFHRDSCQMGLRQSACAPAAVSHAINFSRT